MTSRGTLAAGATVLVAIAVAAAFVAGVGPFGGIDGGVDTPAPTPTSTPTPTPAPAVDGGAPTDGGGGGGGNGGGGGSGTSGDSGDSGGGNEAANLPPYTFDVKRISNCGRTCRDVTVELTNNRETTAQNVVVETHIFAGNSTDAGARVWKGNENVGQMGPGTTTTATKRVTLGFGAALSIQRNDGWITIETTVRSADVTRTFTERRDVI